MFTGLIEEIGRIGSTIDADGSLVIRVHSSTVLVGTKLGDSISVDGVCLTVTALSENSFEAVVSPETLRLTTLGGLKPGMPVNLERSLTLETRLGGHMVQGHVDGTAKVVGVQQEGDCQNWEFQADGDLLKTAIYKGSITVNGVSLTIAGLSDRRFSVALIPKTLEMTTFQFLQPGALVNIESDMIGKYIYKYMEGMRSASNSV